MSRTAWLYWAWLVIVLMDTQCPDASKSVPSPDIVLPVGTGSSTSGHCAGMKTGTTAVGTDSDAEHDVSEVREYSPRHAVVKAMRFDGGFDLNFLEPHEEVSLSSNGRSIIIGERGTKRCIAFVNPGTWLVRKGHLIVEMDDAGFHETYKEAS